MTHSSYYIPIVNTLPPEVVQLIFGLLELKQLVRCLGVCKEWNRILSSLPWLWRHVHLTACSQEMTMDYYAQVLTHLVHLAGDHLQWLKLDIELSEALGIRAIQLIATNRCKYFKRLELNNTSGPEERMLLLRALCNMGPMTTMSFLQLYCLEINLKEVDHLLHLFPNLTHLDLSDSIIYGNTNHHNNNDIDNYFNVIQLPASCTTTRLKVLTLNHIEDSSSIVFDYFLSSCPYLEQFNCYGALPSYEIIQHLNQYNRSFLKTLFYGHHHHHHHHQQEEQQGALQNFIIEPPLQMELDSIKLDQINDQDFISMICYGRAYRTLSKMNIRSCFIPDDTILSQRQLISNTTLWPNLRELDLNSVSGLTLKTGLFAFLDACPVLEKLTFKNIPWWRVTDATLDRWTDHYPRLMDIRYFCQPDDITQTAVERLAEMKYTIIRRQQHSNNKNKNNNFVHLEFNTHTRIHISFPGN